MIIDLQRFVRREQPHWAELDAMHAAKYGKSVSLTVVVKPSG